MNVRLAGLLAVLGAVVALKLVDGVTEDTVKSASSVSVAAVGTANAVQAAMPDVPVEVDATAGAIRLPWPVGADPFSPPAQSARPEPPKQVSVATSPPSTSPTPPPPPQPQPQPPKAPAQPTIFGLWRDGSALRAMMATPQGVVVAGVGDGVMGYRVQRIDTTAITLVDGGGIPLTLPLPALAPDKTFRNLDGSQ